MGAHGRLGFGVACPLSCGPRVEGVRVFLLTQPDISLLGASASGWWVLLTQLSSWWVTGAGHHWGPALTSSGTDGPAGGGGRLHEALGLWLGRRAFVWTPGLVGDLPASSWRATF